jgi:hypothetical protein
MHSIYLNLAGGKEKPQLQLGGYHYLINVDTMYNEGDTKWYIETCCRGWKEKRIKHNVETYLKYDIFKYLEECILKFDIIFIYRFLEHVPMTQVLYFIYLLSTVMKRGSSLDIIVPDYAVLAQMILDEYVFSHDFEADNILLTTELLNEPSCPHASIWTVPRFRKFFELEKRFKVLNVTQRHVFDGRDIYLRALIERV